ncbi:GDSL-type esterase/lipase family protein [Paenibacillus senegalensis]|uniref:GDSL-type esterase/lipase family protein n=1 Tax=Paenibacillus senegalensis TaxID=1465766 RepID=UPI00028A140B|nr:GDSL-type esterase/lipase family protein [Paenibacillus senegalensis]
MSTRLLWRLTGIAALAATVLFVGGFVYAVQSILNPQGDVEMAAPNDGQIQPDPVRDQSRIQILGLGDSLTRGVGDPTGEGYVGRVADFLRGEEEKEVYVWNYAVSGSRTDQLLELIKAENSEVRQSVAKADIVLLTIGGNDLFQLGIGQAGRNEPESLELDFEHVANKLPESVDRLEEILAELAGLNPETRIIYLGLYHPFLSFDHDRLGSALIQEWNSRAIQLSNVYPNLTVVPTYDLFQTYLSRYLSEDHFHPNADGYKRMAERVIQVLQ